MKKIENTAVNRSMVPEIPHIVSSDKYYGIVPHFTSRKGFICRERYNSGKYNTISSNALTNHNWWNGFENESLAGLINELRNAGFTVYEFDTPEEMFAWLAQKD